MEVYLLAMNFQIERKNMTQQLQLSFDNNLVQQFHDLAENMLVGEKNAMHPREIATHLFIVGSLDTIKRKLRALREMHNSKLCNYDKKILTSNKGYFLAETKSTSEETKKQYSEVAYRKIKAGVKMINEARELLKTAGRDGQVLLNISELTEQIVEISSKL